MIPSTEILWKREWVKINGKRGKDYVNIKEYEVTFLEESMDRCFQEASVHVSDVGKSPWTAQTGLTKRLTIQQIKIKGGHYYCSWQNGKLFHRNDFKHT